MAYEVKENISRSDVLLTFLPLNYILNFVGLSCIYCFERKIVYSSYICKFTFIFLILIISTVGNCLFYTMNNSLGRDEDTFSKMFKIFFLLSKFQYLVDMYLVNKYGRKFLVYYIENYQKIDEYLGRAHYKEIKKSMHKMCLLIFLTVLVPIALEIVVIIFKFGWLVTLTHIFEIIFYYLKNSSMVDMVANVSQVNSRLKTIGDTLKNYSCHDGCNMPSVAVIYDNQRNRKISMKNYRTIGSSSARCYFLLTEQCDYINTMYGFRVKLFYLKLALFKFVCL